MLYSFQANEIQLRGPVPDQLYHRYVEFKPFIKGMFTRAGIRGRIFNHALHHQHARVYNYDRSTKYGVFDEPCLEMTQQFLHMVHYDLGFRTFTYVLTLDGLLRFTETGKEFGIDMLSKHSMHSDISIYVAFSGEFFVRRPRRSHHAKSPSYEKSSFDSADHEIVHDNEDEQPPRDPAAYELIIDNDSGTYRPNGQLLGLLHDFLSSNLPGLKIRTMACDDEHLVKMKKEQREQKKSSGNMRTYVQYSGSETSSISSSDQESLDERVRRADRDDVRQPSGPIETGMRIMSDPREFVREWVARDKEKGAGVAAPDAADGPPAATSSSAAVDGTSRATEKSPAR